MTFCNLAAHGLPHEQATVHVGRHELYTEITSGSHASHEQFGSFMGRVKPKGSKTKEQDGPSRFDAWADISQSFQQPRWKMYELEFEKGRDEKVQVFGHYIVATGDEIWCIGGFRPCERAKISLLKLKLHSKCWDDLTPPDNAIAPAWRWGHSACVIGKQVVQKQVISSILLCGGFNKNCNHDDVWHFCPKEKVFTEPQASLQRLPFHGAYHSLAYDSFSEEAYIFGGQCCVGGPYVYSDRDLDIPWNLSWTFEDFGKRCGGKSLIERPG